MNYKHTDLYTIPGLSANYKPKMSNHGNCHVCGKELIICSECKCKFCVGCSSYDGAHCWFCFSGCSACGTPVYKYNVYRCGKCDAEFCKKEEREAHLKTNCTGERTGFYTGLYKYMVMQTTRVPANEKQH